MLQLLYPDDLYLELSASGAACHIELAEIEVTGRFEMKHSIEVTRYLSTHFQRKERPPGSSCEPAPQIQPLLCPFEEVEICSP
jgi:hypothetical protein